MVEGILAKKKAMYSLEDEILDLYGIKNEILDQLNRFNFLNKI